MRMIGEFRFQAKINDFQKILHKFGIPSIYDTIKDNNLKIVYRLWIVEEDDFLKAIHLYEAWKNHKIGPDNDPVINGDTSFKISPSDPQSMLNDVKYSVTKYKRLRCFLTRMIILICVSLFVWDAFESKKITEQKGYQELEVGLTSLQTKLLFDYPLYFEKLEEFLNIYSIHDLNDVYKLSPKAQNDFKALEAIPMWKGLTSLILQRRLHLIEELPYGTLFRKIRQGELWRLVTPVFLHGNFLHLLLNMSWLWILGCQIEERLGKTAFVIFSLLSAAVTNTFQYLVSGPIFLGYSGVLTTMVGFIWIRQKIAPWEGYPLHKSVINFVAIFVAAMCILEIGSLIFQFLEKADISPNIANTAHVSGGLLGIALGYLPFFRRKEE